MGQQDKARPLRSEWSYLVDAEKVGDKELHMKAEASEQECKDVARRLKVEEVETLRLDAVLTRENKGMLVKASGTVCADVVQKCIVTLEPVKSRIEEEFEGFFAEEGNAISFAKAKHERLGKMMEHELEVLEEKDDPEAIIEGKIDIGELAVQFLALGINPYPKAEGAEEEEPVVHKAGRTYNPFAALKNWKSGQEDEK